MRSGSRPTGAPKRGRSPRVALGIIAVVAVLFSAVSVYSCLAGQRTERTNWGGFLGHHLARGLHFAVGTASAVVPVWLAGAALLFFRRKRDWRRAAGAKLLLLGLFVGLSLVSYLAGAGTAQDNFGGLAGANVARLLSVWLGFGAYFVAALLGYWGVVLWLRRGTRSDALQTVFVVSLGSLLDLFLGYFLGGHALLGPPAAAFAPAGRAGLAATGLLVRLLGRPGGLLVLVAAALLVLVVFTSVRLPEFGWLRSLVTGLLRRRPAPRVEAK
ncbi:hypothetical protein FJY71_09975, partial [candidate division WOR-3 bacterium]|nr:hypothetical protein [candidate division WOR-3 bacterium]